MQPLALNRDALAAKYSVFKHWQECRSGRRESLAPWTTTRGEDGRLQISTELRAPDPASALQALMGLQARFIDQRAGLALDDALPHLDVSQPGRVAGVWRLAGVWVEVWHHDTVPAAPTRAQRAARLFRRSPGGRFPYTRRKKETASS